MYVFCIATPLSPRALIVFKTHVMGSQFYMNINLSFLHYYVRPSFRKNLQMVGERGGIPSIHDKRVHDYFSLIAFDKRNPKGPFLLSTIGRRTIPPSIDIFCHYCVRLYTLFSPVAFLLRDITHYLYHLPNNSGALYCSQASSFVQRERESLVTMGVAN